MDLDEWIKYVFPKVQLSDFLDWKYPDFFEAPNLEKKVICSYVGHVFVNIEKMHSEFGIERLAYGLNYIINPFVSLTSYALLDDSVSDEIKIDTISSMSNVFILFERQCDENTKSLNYVCKMWWDFFPRHGTGTRNNSIKKIDQYILMILESLLKYKSHYCVESALHGLGHWHAGYPEEVETIIENNTKHIPAKLLEYADKCKHGITF